MSHFPDMNKPAFCDSCERLRALGYDVKSPHEVQIQVDPNWTDYQIWEAYMKADLALLLECKSVVVLPHWQSSRGAQLEVHLAHALKMPVVPYEVVYVQAPMDAAPPAGSVDA